MANATVTTQANWIPDIWSNEVKRAMENKKVMAGLVKRFDADVSREGDTIYVPNLANLTAVDKTAGSDLTPSANTEDKNTITINKHKAVYMLLEDIAQIQSKPNLMKEYSAKAGEAIQQAMDTDLCELYSGLTNFVGDCSTAITDANLIKAIRYLDDANAPLDNRQFVVDGGGVADIRAVDKFVTFNNRGTGKALTDATVGEFYGIPVYVSNSIATDTGTIATTHGLLFHKEAFALAVQQKPKVETARKLASVGDELLVTILYGIAEYRDDFAVDFRYSI